MALQVSAHDDFQVWEVRNLGLQELGIFYGLLRGVD